MTGPEAAKKISTGKKITEKNAKEKWFWELDENKILYYVSFDEKTKKWTRKEVCYCTFTGLNTIEKDKYEEYQGEVPFPSSIFKTIEINSWVHDEIFKDR